MYKRIALLLPIITASLSDKTIRDRAGEFFTSVYDWWSGKTAKCKGFVHRAREENSEAPIISFNAQASSAGCAELFTRKIQQKLEQVRKRNVLCDTFVTSANNESTVHEVSLIQSQAVAARCHSNYTKLIQQRLELVR